MSDSGENSSTQNGTSPIQRLSSFKSPRDLSLGGIKPNKKIFTPNLNVTRNKNKSAGNTQRETKKELEKGRRDRKNDKNKNVRNGPAIIKSSGVFSEGMGATERRPSNRVSYGREVAGPTLEKPTIRVKEAWKIDKELEEQKIKTVMGEEDHMDSDEELQDMLAADAPVRLPLLDTGNWFNKRKVATKEEVIIKQEPKEDNHVAPAGIVNTEPLLDIKKEVYDENDIVGLFKGDKPKLILLQLPDSLPGRGGDAEPMHSKKTAVKSADTPEGAVEEENEKPDGRCRLKDLEEGRVGRLLIHRSGKVRLALGDALFEVAAGTRAAFRQEAVAAGGERGADLVALGPLRQKLNLTPDWEAMFKDITV